MRDPAANAIMARVVLQSGVRRKSYIYLDRGHVFEIPPWLNVVVDRPRGLDLSVLESRASREAHGINAYYYRASTFRTVHVMRKELYEDMDDDSSPRLVVFDLRGEKDEAKRNAFIQTAERVARGTVTRYIGMEERLWHFRSGLPQVWLICSARPNVKQIEIERWRFWNVSGDGVSVKTARGRPATVTDDERAALTVGSPSHRRPPSPAALPPSTPAPCSRKRRRGIGSRE